MSEDPKDGVTPSKRPAAATTYRYSESEVTHDVVEAEDDDQLGAGEAPVAAGVSGAPGPRTSASPPRTSGAPARASSPVIAAVPERVSARPSPAPARPVPGDVPAAAPTPVGSYGGLTPISSIIPSEDPRFAKVEQLVGRGQWDKVCEVLGAENDLPPALLFVHALAQRESNKTDSASRTDREAIEAMSRLLGVSPTSALALVIAKRTLRRSPAAWQDRKAPKPWLSILIALAAMGLGGGVGYLVFMYLN